MEVSEALGSNGARRRNGARGSNGAPGSNGARGSILICVFGGLNFHVWEFGPFLLGFGWVWDAFRSLNSTNIASGTSIFTFFKLSDVRYILTLPRKYKNKNPGNNLSLKQDYLLPGMSKRDNSGNGYTRKLYSGQTYSQILTLK